MWGSFSQTATNKKAIEAAQERTHTVRVALMRMAREIEMAYLSDIENTALSERRTFFVGSSHGDVDELHVLELRAPAAARGRSPRATPRSSPTSASAIRTIGASST